MTVLVEQERNAALFSWYRIHQRTFPWRGVTDPYSILVSETMLQQTQASRVVPFYERFITRFPTAASLTDGDLHEVLTLWTGLGYNSRALRLRDTARLVTEHGWPTTPETLTELPGVGPYTAAAVASFAFGARVAAIDTNFRRVLSRWHGEPLHGAALRAAAETALGDPAPDWNQAMMDLGAMRCTARDPDCRRCPVRDWCSGPSGYRPPVAQGRFEGSARQLRGAIVRTLISGPVTATEISHRTGFRPAEVESALADLSSEGLIAEDGAGTYEIAE
jgi:A/G-specific adenine glycosylase